MSEERRLCGATAHTMHLTPWPPGAGAADAWLRGALGKVRPRRSRPRRPRPDGRLLCGLAGAGQTR